MPYMPSGELSGVYYIPVSGLPWSCTWQTLKDFTRGPDREGAQINVDRAYVFPGTTDGYIIVKGKDNFDKALAHLNGGVLENRALLADGRNEHGSVMIRDECPSTTSKHRHEHPTPMPTTPLSATEAVPSAPPSLSIQSNLDPESPSFTMHSDTNLENRLCRLTLSEYRSPPSPQFTHTAQPQQTHRYYGQTYQHYEPIYQPCSTEFRSPPVTPSDIQLTNTALAQLVCKIPLYIPEPPPPTTQAVFSSAISYHQATYYQKVPQPTTAVPSTNASISAGRPSSTMKTKSRKIIITRLPPTTRQEDLRLLLENLLSSILTTFATFTFNIRGTPSASHPHPRDNKADLIEQLELAKHTDGKARGHAFATFNTEESAKGMIRALNGMEWMGRVLKAKFTKEGVGRSGEAANGSVAKKDRSVVRGCEGRQKEKERVGNGEEKKDKLPVEGITILKRPDAPMVVNGSGKAKVRAGSC